MKIETANYLVALKGFDPTKTHPTDEEVVDLGSVVTEPYYVVALSFDDADTDITYLTSNPLALDPGGVAAIDRIDGVIQDISGQSQRIQPDTARSSIGSIRIKFVDVLGELTTKINTKLGGGEGLRKKRIQVYKGFRTLTAWADYSLRFTFLVEKVDYQDGVYTFLCGDIQRESKTKLFPPDSGSLESTISASSPTIPIQTGSAATKFKLVEHDLRYSANAPIERVLDAFDLSTANWTKTNVTINVDQVNDPFNVLQADQVVSNGTPTGRVHQSFDTTNPLTNRTFRWEVWLRTDVTGGQPVNATLEIRDLSGGDIGTVPVVLTDDWQKFIFYHTFGDPEPDSVVQFAVLMDPLATNGQFLYYGGSSFYEQLLVGYVKIDEEVIAHAGWNPGFTALTVIQRGALNTKPTSHTVTAVEIDKKKKVDEYFYLEMPAPKMIHALLTGVLFNQLGTLPSHWHLGIDTAFVRASDFTGIGIDLYNSDDETGKVARFIGIDEVNGKSFIEKELLLWLAAFMPIYADGQYGLKRLQNVLPDANFNAVLTDSDVTKYGKLTYSQSEVINNIAINWNWIDSLQRYTKVTQLIDSDSIAKYDTAPLRTFEFQGVFTGLHTDQNILNYFDQIRDRYGAPPLRINVEVTPEWERLEVGDIVRLSVPQIVEYYTDGAVDRAFEVQRVTVNLVSGRVNLDLFGGVEEASVSPISSTFVMQDAFYTQGTDLNTVLTIVGGAVTANGTITGSADNRASVYFFDGDLTINAGVTVTTTGNVQLRIKGGLTINGELTSKGGGMAGGAGGRFDPPFGFPQIVPPSPGVAGVFGSTREQRGVRLWYNNKISTAWQHVAMHTNDRWTTSVDGQYNSFPALELSNPDGLSIGGIIPDLRGTGGCGGAPNMFDHWVNNVGTTGAQNGGAGGDGGGGIVIISRGLFFGGSGILRTSGDDANGGVDPSLIVIPTTGSQGYAGAGSGGYPGGCLVLLDGNSTAPSLLNFETNTGVIPFGAAATRNVSYAQNQILGLPHGSIVRMIDPTLHGSNQPKSGLVRIIYIPPAAVPFVWFPEDESGQVTTPDTTVPSGGGSGQVLTVDETGVVTWVDPGVQTATSEYCPGYPFTWVSSTTWRITGINAEHIFAKGRRLKFIESVGGATKFGGVTAVDFGITSPGDTTILMSMESGATLANQDHEVCFVTGATAWSPIVENPIPSGINDIATGTVGAEEIYLIVGNGGTAAFSSNGGVGWTPITTGILDDIVGCQYHPGSQTFYLVTNVDDQGVYSWDGIASSISAVTVPWLTVAGDTLQGIRYGYGENVLIITYVDATDGRRDFYYTQDEFTTHLSRTPNAIQTAGTSTNGSAGRHPGIGSNVITIGNASQTTSFSNVADTTQFTDETFSIDVTAIERIKPLGFLPTPAPRGFVGLSNGDIGVSVDGGGAVIDDITLSSAVRGFAYSEFHNRTVAFGDNAGIAWVDDVNSLSVDAWTFSQNGFAPTANIVCGVFNENDGIFVLGADNGQICRSGTGVSEGVVPPVFNGFQTIQAATPFGGAAINDMATGPIGATNFYIAVGAGGAAAYSNDSCATWNTITTGTTENLLCIAYDSVNQEFMIGGTNGKILHSTNGTTFSDPQVTTIASLLLGGNDNVEDIEFYIDGAGWNASVNAATGNAKVSTADKGITWVSNVAANASEVLRNDESVSTQLRMYGIRSTNYHHYDTLTDATQTNYVSNLGFEGKAVEGRNSGTSLESVVGGVAGEVRAYDPQTLQSTHATILIGDVTDICFSPTLLMYLVTTAAGELAILETANIAVNESMKKLNHGFDGSPMNGCVWNAADAQFVAFNATGQIALSTVGIDP